MRTEQQTGTIGTDIFGNMVRPVVAALLAACAFFLLASTNVYALGGNFQRHLIPDSHDGREFMTQFNFHNMVGYTTSADSNNDPVGPGFNPANALINEVIEVEGGTLIGVTKVSNQRFNVTVLPYGLDTVTIRFQGDDGVCIYPDDNLDNTDGYLGTTPCSLWGPADDIAASAASGRSKFVASDTKSITIPFGLKNIVGMDFLNMPQTYDASSFTFDLRIGAASGITNSMLESGFVTTNVKSVEIVDTETGPQTGTQRTVTVTPASDNDVSIAFRRTYDCENADAICTSGGGRLWGVQGVTVEYDGTTPGGLMMMSPDYQTAVMTGTSSNRPSDPVADVEGNTPRCVGQPFSATGAPPGASIVYSLLPPTFLIDTHDHENPYRDFTVDQNGQIWTIPGKDYRHHESSGGSIAARRMRVQARIDGTDTSATSDVNIMILHPDADNSDAPCHNSRPAPQLSVADARGWEHQEVINFEVTLNVAASQEVTVDYETATDTNPGVAGAATAGDDFTPTSGTLTFLAGETTKTVSVVIINDTEPDSGETFFLELASPTGGATIPNDGRGRAIGTILNDEVEGGITAVFEDVPESHDGSSDFTFTLTLSENIGDLGHKTLRDSAFTVTGGRVKRAARQVSGSNEGWNITVEPAVSGAVTVTLPETTDCAATGALCTTDDRALTGAVTASIPGPDTVTDSEEPEGLTASFENVPESHDGSSYFTFRLAFSEAIDSSFRTLRDDAFSVTGGTVNRAKRVDRRSDLWEIRIAPAGGTDAVSVSLPATTGACSDTGAICTAGGLKLSNGQEATIPHVDNVGQGGGGITAQFRTVPESHDGSSAFTFLVELGEAITLRSDSFAVSHGSVMNVNPHAGSTVTEQGGHDFSSEWDVTVTPTGADTVSVLLLDTRTCVIGATQGDCQTKFLESAQKNVPHATASQPLSVSFVHTGLHAGSAVEYSTLLLFSEEVAHITATELEDAIYVENGVVQRAERQVDDSSQYWRIFLLPDGDANITVSLTAPAGACGSGGFCSTDGGKLTGVEVTTIGGPNSPAVDDVSGAEIDEGAGAQLVFTVTLSEPVDELVTVNYDTRDGTAKAGQDYEYASGTLRFAANETSNTVSVTVLDDEYDEGAETMLLVLTSVTGGNVVIRDSLGIGTINEGTDTLPVPPRDPLTALFDHIGTHDGSAAHTVLLWFNEAVSSIPIADMSDAISVTNGSLQRVNRLNGGGSSQFWRMHLLPDGTAAMTVTLTAPSAACGSGGFCTVDGEEQLTGSYQTTIQGPNGPMLTVDDVEVDEGPNETLRFSVRLSRAATGTVIVNYATQDGTAHAGTDYTATSGTLSFAAGDTVKTVPVTVLDDAHDEGSEFMKLVLSGPSGSNAGIGDFLGIGTINNSDPMQQAWLSRFGRTVGTHVTDAVGDRLRGTPGQASHVTIGGQRMPLGRQAGGDANQSEPSPLLSLAGALGLNSAQMNGSDATAVDPRLGQSRSLNLDLRQVLMGSSFRLNMKDGSAQAPGLTAWGRFAGTRFDGQDGDLSLDGDVFTGTVGIDSEWGRWLAGVAMAHSRGEGQYTMPIGGGRDQGDLENSLTSIHPYLRYAVTDRLQVWGMMGYSWGELEMDREHETLETDTDFIMGAFGGRGILMDTGGFQLATRTDAMFTQTSSDAVDGMAATEADAHRLRVVLEGSRGLTLAEGRTLTPTVEVGVRHDWGDAETGFGLEVGGRFRYADTRLGLTIEGTVRGLVAHEDEQYHEWGASGNVRLAPGANGHGLALSLSPTWGVAQSGVEGLWNRQTTQGLAPTAQQVQNGQLAAEVGYGFPAFDTGLLTPYAGTVLAEGATRTYRVGTRLQLNTGLLLNLEGARQESTGPQPVNQGVQLQIGWGF